MVSKDVEEQYLLHNMEVLCNHICNPTYDEGPTVEICLLGCNFPYSCWKGDLNEPKECIW